VRVTGLHRVKSRESRACKLQQLLNSFVFMAFLHGTFSEIKEIIVSAGLQFT